MTPKLRPNYADSVTATSWSPRPKTWVGNHYRPELWTRFGDGEVQASISMNNKWMDESDVSASVASPADYIPYFSLPLDHLVLTSIDT